SMRHSGLLVCLWLLSQALIVLPEPSKAEDVREQVMELVREGHLNQALEELQKAAVQTPRDAKIQNMLGVVLTELGRLEQANEAYNRALSLTPDFFPARKNRAVNAFSLGDYKFAAIEFKTLVKQEPKDFVPHLFLGLLAMERNDWSAALPHLLEARQLTSNNARILLALSRVRFALAERQLALECVRTMRASS